MRKKRSTTTRRSTKKAAGAKDKSTQSPPDPPSKIGPNADYFVADRDEAERGVLIRSSFVVISISDPGSPTPKVRRPSHCLGVLHLSFHDAEPHRSLPAGVVLISSEQAQAIRAFVEEHSDAGAFLVHCEQGASRSPAVAAAICRASGGDPSSFFEDYVPNQFVYETVFKAFGATGPRAIISQGTERIGLMRQPPRTKKDTKRMPAKPVARKPAKKRSAGKKTSKASSVHLYASAPGLMIHSPDAVSEFIAGESYTDDLGSRRTPAGRLVGDARIVMLSTGSPGLDYMLSFHLGEPPTDVASEALDTAEFQLDVRGDTLVVRDGYQAEYWGDPDYAKVEVPVPSGLYGVVASYLPHEQHGHMRIHLFLSPAKKKLAKPQGWINLDYVT